MTHARDVVFRLLKNWSTLEDPPFLPERGHPDWAALAPRDRPFAFDLLTGILRWRSTLDTIIATRLRQPIDSLEIPIRAALWLGAYQLLFQGTANYAAVNTAVTLAKEFNPAAGGLVNAVLRAITRLGPRKVAVEKSLTLPQRLARHAVSLDFETDLRFNADIFRDPAIALAAHLAAVRSHPRPLVDHLLKLYSERAGEILLHNNQRPVVTLRVDAAAIDVPAATGLVAHETAPNFLVAREGWNDLIESRVEHGTLSPQDPTAAKPVRQAAALVAAGTLPRPAKILDLCAGLGTKTIQLARTFPEAQVIATDIDTVKLTRLENRVKALGLKNISVHTAQEIENRKSKIENDFDWALVDVPCSNLGVMAKRVQSRWRWPTLDHAALATLQEKLLAQAATLAPVVIYATCSIDPEENEKRVAKFAAANSRWKVVHEELTLPAGATAGPRDGGYYAVLRAES